MNEKKVIAVIVEGPSDEAALGSILKEYFSSAEIQLFETAVFIQLLKVSSRMGCNMDERIKEWMITLMKELVPIAGEFV